MRRLKLNNAYSISFNYSSTKRDIRQLAEKCTEKRDARECLISRYGGRWHFQRVVIIATKSEEVLIHFKSDLFASMPSPSSRCTDLVTVFAAILTIRQQLEISVLEWVYCRIITVKRLFWQKRDIWIVN